MKEFAPLGANLFKSRPFLKGFHKTKEANRHSQKLSPFEKNVSLVDPFSKAFIRLTKQTDGHKSCLPLKGCLKTWMCTHLTGESILYCELFLQRMLLVVYIIVADWNIFLCLNCRYVLICFPVHCFRDQPRAWPSGNLKPLPSIN